MIAIFRTRSTDDEDDIDATSSTDGSDDVTSDGSTGEAPELASCRRAVEVRFGREQQRIHSSLSTHDPPAHLESASENDEVANTDAPSSESAE